MTTPTPEPAPRTGEPVPPPPTPKERRRVVLRREKEAYGGVKMGSAFFGWLTATGMAVILTALLAALGAGVGLVSDNQDVTDTASENGISADEITWAGVIAVIVIVVIAYYAGGYVAGRMARFDGAKQGVAVWLWAVIIAVVIAVLGLVAGDEFNVLDDVNAFPRIPDNLGDVGAQGWVALLGVIVGALVGAVLGGLAGMRYHRRVDRAGVGA